MTIQSAPVSAMNAPARPEPGRVVVVPGTGLQFPQRLPFDAWLAVGRQLSAVASSSAWCLGDWLAYGQQAYGGRYREAVERTGLEYQTLRNYAWVARQFAMSRRRDTLSFGHHAEVASLPEPEQDFWLRKAGEHGWPTRYLRQQVRASLQERGSSGAVAPAGTRSVPAGEDPQVTVQVRLTAQQAQLYKHAADQMGLAVPAWAVQVLDSAVHGTLHHARLMSPAALTAPAADREAPEPDAGRHGPDAMDAMGMRRPR
jgi:hypothetical protein